MLEHAGDERRPSTRDQAVDDAAQPHELDGGLIAGVLDEDDAVGRASLPSRSRLATPPRPRCSTRSLPMSRGGMPRCRTSRRGPPRRSSRSACSRTRSPRRRAARAPVARASRSGGPIRRRPPPPGRATTRPCGGQPPSLSTRAGVSRSRSTIAADEPAASARETSTWFASSSSSARSTRRSAAAVEAGILGRARHACKHPCRSLRADAELVHG